MKQRVKYEQNVRPYEHGREMCFMSHAPRKSNQLEQILQSAYGCIASRGYANVSMRDIADEAGVALSQITYHYKSKEGLLSAVIKRMMTEYLVEIEAQLERGATPQDRLSGVILYFDRLLADTPGLIKLFFDFTSLSLWSAPIENQLRNLTEDLASLVERHVLRGVSEGSRLGFYDPKSVARMLLGSILGAAMLAMTDPDGPSLPEVLRPMELIIA